MNPSTFNEIFNDIVALNAKEGPSSNIFEPKFKAREQLEKLKETLISLYIANKSLITLQQLCRCLVLMGSIMIEVEESEEGALELRKAYRLLQYCIKGELTANLNVEPVTLEEVMHSTYQDPLKEHHYAECVEFVRVHNALAIYLSNARPDDAIKILLLAEKAYQDWDRWYIAQQSCACTIDSIPVGDDGRLRVEDILQQGDAEYLKVITQRHEMDEAYTSTLFYLAQLHAALQNTTLASKYCHLTMYYQLMCKKEFSRKVWATNALHLSFFYSSYFAYGQALYCLKAGQIMMSKEDADESTSGLVAWAFGRYHMNRLEYYGSLIHNPSDNNPPREDFVSYWKDFPIEGLGPIEEQPDIVTLNDAREAFKAGEKALDDALKFHPFETSCTQNIQILQDKAKLHSYLSFFETNRSRKIAILQCQIDLLENIPDQLSFNAYPIVVRQLLYDLGSFYEDLINLRKKQKTNPKKGETPLTDLEYNALVNKCKGYYVRFCDTWKQPQTSVIPDVLDKDSRHPFFRSLLRLARVEINYAFSNAKEEFDAIGKTIEAYKKAIKFAEKNFTDEDLRKSVEKEEHMAKEMVNLLMIKQHDMSIAHQSGFLD
ncbi:unnamed protein product [Phytomonas sp. EM1]|nr:unnamed protein product [Phytomonas sp. EM1]|eukprot:CCW64323.1 unnamed protein product [Phytomonas sp. isolate EM1]